MKTMGRVAAVLVLCCFAWALPARARSFFHTAQDLVDGWNEQKHFASGKQRGEPGFAEMGHYYGYVAAIADAFNEKSFSIPSGTSIVQAGAVVGKYLEEHRETWSEPASGVVANALREAFPRHDK